MNLKKKTKHKKGEIWNEFVLEKTPEGYFITHPSEDASYSYFIESNDAVILAGIEMKCENCAVFDKNTYRIGEVREGLKYDYHVPHQDYIIEAFGRGGKYSKVIRIHGKDIEGRWIFGEYKDDIIIDWIKGEIRPNNKNKMYEVHC